MDTNNNVLNMRMLRLISFLESLPIGNPIVTQEMKLVMEVATYKEAEKLFLESGLSHNTFDCVMYYYQQSKD